MAYDRYDTRHDRDERSRWSGDRHEGRDSGRRDERGFFERAGEEIASWFGDDDGDRRHRDERMHREREGERHQREPDRARMSSPWGGDRDRERERSGRGRDEDRGFQDRGWERGQGRGYSASERDYNPSWQREMFGSRDTARERHYGSERDRGYRPMTGDYGRSEQFFAASGVGRGERGMGDYGRGDYGRQENRRDRDRSDSEWGRDPYRQTSRGGTTDQSDRSRHEDPHYNSWRERHMGDLDRDYDDYRREHQAKFEDDFAGWREKRQQKRGLLGQIREHMDVVGNDEQPVGTIDKTAGDRIILTKSDSESGGAHHSLSCSDIDRVEGNRVILGCSAEQAKQRWRDENRNRALFEREDQGEMGPRALDRSFEGTYR